MVCRNMALCPNASCNSVAFGPQSGKRSILCETGSAVARARSDGDERVLPDPLARAPLVAELIESDLKLIRAEGVFSCPSALPQTVPRTRVDRMDSQHRCDLSRQDATDVTSRPH